MDAHEINGCKTAGNATDDDDFLIREGFDLLATYRSIKSQRARESVLDLVAALVEAEQEAARARM